MSDFEVGGPLHSYLEAKFLPLSTNVEEVKGRVSLLEQRVVDGLEEATKVQDGRITKLEMWRSYIAGAVATVGIAWLLSREIITGWLLPHAGPK